MKIYLGPVLLAAALVFSSGSTTSRADSTCQTSCTDYGYYSNTCTTTCSDGSSVGPSSGVVPGLGRIYGGLGLLAGSKGTLYSGGGVEGGIQIGRGPEPKSPLYFMYDVFGYSLNLSDKGTKIGDTAGAGLVLGAELFLGGDVPEPGSFDLIMQAGIGPVVSWDSNNNNSFFALKAGGGLEYNFTLKTAVSFIVTGILPASTPGTMFGTLGLTLR